MLVQAGQRRDAGGSMKRGPELGRGPVLERAEIDLQPDDGEVRVQAGADVDGAVEDAH